MTFSPKTSYQHVIKRLLFFSVYSYRYPEVFVDRDEIRAMQSQLQTVINNSLSSSIALTGILPQIQSTVVFTGRSNDGGHDKIEGGKEGYSPQQIRERNKRPRTNSQQRTMTVEQMNGMFK